MLPLWLIEFAGKQTVKQLLDMRRRARGLTTLDLTFGELKESEEYLKIGKHITHYASMISICKEIVTVREKYRVFALCFGRSISDR